MNLYLRCSNGILVNNFEALSSLLGEKKNATEFCFLIIINVWMRKQKHYLLHYFSFHHLIIIICCLRFKVNGLE